jgi:predicted aspartyl protease
VTFPYQPAYVPPAPVLTFQLAAPDAAPAAELHTALIDTGADTCLVPKSILLRLGAPALFEAQLRSPWGEPHAVMVYLADLIVDDQRFPGLELAADEMDSEFILGRNFLNKLGLVLNGPDQTTHLLTAAVIQRLRRAPAP